MDQDTDIINANARNEKVKNFLIKNKKKIVIFFSSIVLIFFGYFAYEEFKEKNKVKIANNYNIVVAKFNSGQKNNTEKELINIVNEKDRTYSPLALYFLIDNNILSDKVKINELFDIVIDETPLEKEIKFLVIYKKALFNSDTESENNLIKIINPLIKSDSIWKSHGLYLMAEYFYSKNEKQKSKEFYEQIINLENSNTKIKLEAHKRLNRDFSE